jgi:hypothetical protein
LEKSEKEHDMNISPRTKTIIDLVPKGHRLTAAMIGVITDVSAAYEGFSGHRIALQSKMKPQALGEELSKSFTQNYGKQWARANSSVAKVRKEITARDAALVIKDADQSYAGVHGRWEARQWLLSLEPSVRHAVAETTEDIRILESMVTAPPQLSGVNLPALAAKIERRYKEVMYPAELAAIAADSAVVVPAEQACHISRNEMRSTIDLHQIDFDALMKGIDVGRPWLIDDDRQVCETGVDGKPTYRPATENDRAFGVRYKNYDEYKAAQGIAA